MTTRYVAHGESIQAAIDQSAPGDTVRLLSGVYLAGVAIAALVSALMGC
jgi:hypothetical protein